MSTRPKIKSLEEDLEAFQAGRLQPSTGYVRNDANPKIDPNVNVNANANEKLDITQGNEFVQGVRFPIYGDSNENDINDLTFILE